MDQVTKKYIYLSGAKSNDPLHIVYIANAFKFTNTLAKGTQGSLRRLCTSTKASKETQHNN